MYLLRTLADDGQFTLIFREPSGYTPLFSRKTGANCPSPANPVNSYNYLSKS